MLVNNVVAPVPTVLAPTVPLNQNVMNGQYNEMIAQPIQGAGDAFNNQGFGQQLVGNGTDLAYNQASAAVAQGQAIVIEMHPGVEMDPLSL